MPIHATNADIFLRSDLSSLLKGEHLDLLQTMMRPRHLSAGDVLFHQGRRDSSMALLLRGRLGVQVRDSRGREHQLCQLRPGEVVGEMNCIDPTKGAATVWAQGSAEICTIDRRPLAYLQRRNPAVLSAMMRSLLPRLCKRLRGTHKLIEYEIRDRNRQLRPGGADPKRGALQRMTAPPRRQRTAYRGSLPLERISDERGLAIQDLKRLVSLTPPVIYADREILCTEGDVGDCCFLVAKGRVDVIKMMEGRLRRLATVQAPTMLGQLALVDSVQRSSTLRARGPVVAIEIRRSIFGRLLAGGSPLGVRFQHETAVAGIRQIRHANACLVKVLDRLAKPRSASHSYGLGSGRPAESACRQGRTAPDVGRGRRSRKASYGDASASTEDLDAVSFSNPSGIMHRTEVSARRSKV